MCVCCHSADSVVSNEFRVSVLVHPDECVGAAASQTPYSSSGFQI